MYRKHSQCWTERIGNRRGRIGNVRDSLAEMRGLLSTLLSTAKLKLKREV